MATARVICAGFGGQGIQTMSKFLAYSAMDNNLNVSWLPSYGPEMRGGTSNCSVILGKDEVASPIITNADAVIVMNNPSLEKFQSYLKKDEWDLLIALVILNIPVTKLSKIYNVSIQAIYQKRKRIQQKIKNICS